MGKQPDQKPRKRVVRGTQTQLPEAPAQRAEMEERRSAAKKRKKAKTPVPLRGIAWVVRSIFKVLAIVVLVCVIAGCIGGTALTVFVMKYVDTESGYDLENMEMTYTSNVYAKDADGQDVIIRSLAARGNRDWLDIDKIPVNVQHAIISAEDERFYEHEGVDWMRTFAAFANMAFQMVTGSEKEFFSGGASTITQQLIKNINGDFADETRTPATKMKEILAALNLEKNFTKQQILEGYINYISMGHNNYGIQAGAQYYFGKDAADLSIVEAASLAAVTKSPSGLNPLDAPEDNKTRRGWILDVMLKNGYITEQEHKEAKAAKLKVIDYTEDDDDQKKDDIFTWYEDAVIVEVIEDLMEKYDYSYETAKGKVMGGGMQIYSSLDLKVQERLDQEFEVADNFNDWEPEDAPDVTMVIMDYQGHIVAMEGGRDKKTTNLSFNPVTQGNLKMGSCMKPITVYAPAWDQDLIYWSQIRTDEPKLDIGEGRVNWPRNAGGSYTGKRTLIDALRRSLNTIPVELEMEMGMNEVLHWLKDTLHLSTIDMVNDSWNATLGNLTVGTHMDEFTAAFTMFGNGGFYTPPTTYTKVLDATGKVMLESDTVYEQVISKQTSYIMNRALREVTTGNGTGTAAALDDYGIEVVGKTGTTESTARSFIGLTPYHVASVWYGYLEGEREVSESYVYSPARIWRNIMKDIYEDYEGADFTMDDEGVSKQAYCTSTGLMARSSCSKGYGYFKDDVTIPTCSGYH